MGVVTYRYRVKGRGSAAQRRAVLEHMDLLVQHHLAHRLRNDIVSIEHAIEDQIAAMWSQFPQVAEIEAKLAEQEEQVAARTAAVKAERVARRSTAVPEPLRRGLAEAKAAVAELRKQRRAVKTEIGPLAKPHLEALEVSRKAQIKSLYEPYCQTGKCLCCHACAGYEGGLCTECGGEHSLEKLHWATYNVVTRGNAASRKVVGQRRRMGEFARLQFHRWDTTGRIAVQLPWRPGDPLRTGKNLTSPDGKYSRVLRLPQAAIEARRRPDRAGEFEWYIGHGRMVTLPAVFHRPLPDSAEVTAAQLVRTRVGSHFQMHICLAVNTPDPEPPGGTRAAVHFGWRRLADETVRVATWRSVKSLQQVPPQLADIVVVDDTGQSGEIIAPAAWKRINEHHAALASIRERNFGEMREKVAVWLEENPQPGVTAGEVRTWRSPSRLVTVARMWKHEAPGGEGSAEMLQWLEDWRKQDRHLWDWHSNGVRNHLDHRRDTWRNIATWLGDQIAELVVDDTNFAAIRRKPGLTEDTVLPSAAADKARSTAVSVAPGELRMLMVEAATRRQVTVTKLPAKGLSLHHADCGHTNKTGLEFATSVEVVCGGCGRNYDQDHNATTLLLRGAESAAK